MRSFASALSDAVATVRQSLNDPIARVVVIAPASPNATLARQSLASATAFFGVDFLTPEGLFAPLGRLSLAKKGLRPEPPGWMEATLLELLPRLDLGPYGVTLRQPGWMPALVASLKTLQDGEISAQDLAGSKEHGPGPILLATLLEALDQARAQEGLFGHAQERQAALEALGPDAMGGCVLLGDRSLPLGTFRCLQAWIASHKGVRLAIPPLEALPPAPLGMRLAGASLPVLAVKPSGHTRLDELKAALFNEGACSVGDDTITLASTPDEVREAREAVRMVQRAIAQHVPLDRIAIALPDALGAEALRADLERAGIPTSWLTGPPLATSPGARFLCLALSIAQGQDSLPTWYDLLRHPGSRGAQPAEVEGRGRWRRILTKCGAVVGTKSIIDAVRAWAEEQGPDDNGDRAAANGLAQAMGALHQALDRLPRKAPLSGHGMAWREMLRLHRQAGPERRQLEALLEGWGASPQGPELTLAQAMTILQAALASATLLQGKPLTAPAIRVAQPMALLGGTFDLVCVLGLTQGRFPKEREEDVLLPDALIRALNGSGKRLAESSHREDAERRRLAAALACCEGRVWLSVPQGEMKSARPTLAGTLVLEVARALAGRRVRYEELGSLMVRAGGRGSFAPHDPNDAVTLEELLLSTVRADPDRALQYLAGHPWAQGLLRLHRSLDRLHRPKAGQQAQMDEYTGRISPHLLADPASGACPAKAHILKEAALQPGRYLFRRLLKAWGTDALLSAFDPAEERVLGKLIVDTIHDAVVTLGPQAGPQDCLRAFETALDQAMSTRMRFVPDPSDRAGLARDIAMEKVEFLLQVHGSFAPGPRGEYQDLPLAPGWRLMGTFPYLGEGRLVAYTPRDLNVKGLQAQKELDVVLQGLALQEAHEEVTSLELRDLKGGACRGELTSVAAEARDIVERTKARVAEGIWPVGKDAPEFALGGEREVEP